MITEFSRDESGDDWWPPMYYNNFEVVRVQEFRRHPGMRLFMDKVTKSGSIYRHRWGDAPLRYFTLRLFFAENDPRVQRLGEFQPSNGILTHDDKNQYDPGCSSFDKIVEWRSLRAIIVSTWFLHRSSVMKIVQWSAVGCLLVVASICICLLLRR